MRKFSGSMAALVVLVGTAPNTLAAQDDSWQHKWYWGGQGGVTTFGPGITAVTTGGHWFITGRRSAFYFGVDALLFGLGSGGETINVANSQSPTGVTEISFDRGNRIEFLLYAIPSSSRLQIYAGGGFAINQVRGANPTSTTLGSAELNSITSIIDDLDTKAFAVVSGGLQLRLGRLGLYGEYRFLPASDNFLLNTNQHSFLGGLRFALTHAHESIETDR